MSDRAEVDAYLAEAASLIRRAEECTSRLHKDGACEGHRLMAAAALMAMHRINLLMKAHRDLSAAGTAPPPVAYRLPEKRRWWQVVSSRSPAYRSFDL